ncbi:MAG TPA: type II secretion system minor pseudopilin GspJ [Zoogloea sp.]|uniref:type II secretion system minor pseudopilin GspJ n=1 Tax=Zoogloea sp. TaxID=49181 RepID=UPI002CF9A9E5|nr:type II secretion system minor pseudopilin GspJ [Zoogloea sp.]HOB44715.1 type II secretion system minor pseudopilin GspJ [Zoogloea sp.]HQA09659.1 type II secretion system minor pseudopilin GspJ [Zoogloea sp.]
MSRSARQRGLTLIELMVALAIFAILGVLSYRALAEVANSRARLEEHFERWRAIGRSMQRIDADLIQVVAPVALGVPASGLPNGQTTANSAAAPMILGRAASGGGPEFQFLRLDDTRGVRRVGYRLVDGRLDWLRWSGRDALGEPTVEPLLTNVRDLRWRFLLNNTRLDAWPPGDNRNPLPDAVILELDLPDVGVITRMIALR